MEPIHGQLLTWRLCGAAGIARTGNRIQDRIQEVLGKMVESGELLSDGDFLSLKDQVVLLRDRSELPNQERNPDFVSNQELLETQKTLGLAESEGKIWRALGYARVTTGMMERLEGLSKEKN